MIERDRLAEQFLKGRIRFGMKFGLGTMQRLLGALGNPQQRYPILLVAGTNGKGSVVAYCDAILRASGLKVGRYTSPHLITPRERIAVNGRMIGMRAFTSQILTIKEALDKERGHISATYFEVMTLAAFRYFETVGVDVAVMEVGLGGRLDATNASEPLASAITTIALDHEAILGSSLAQIAHEKAGVMRPERSTILGKLPGAARRAIVADAGRLGAKLVDAHKGAQWETHNCQLGLRTPYHHYRDLRPLPGAFQIDNLVVAIRLIEEARRAGLPVDLRSIVVTKGVRDVRWPGRLQSLPGRPRVIVDGAHNPAAARALRAELKHLKPLVMVFGAMQDKDFGQMGRLLFPLCDAVVITKPSVARAATPGAIAKGVGAAAKAAHHMADVRRALRLAAKLAGTKTVVVTGSLYLVGEVLKLRSQGEESTRRRRTRK